MSDRLAFNPSFPRRGTLHDEVRVRTPSGPDMIECSGEAEIVHKHSGQTILVDAASLDIRSADESGLAGPERLYVASTRNESLGMLAWVVDVYPAGHIKDVTHYLNGHILVRDVHFRCTRAC